MIDTMAMISSFKRCIAILLAAVLMLTCCLPAFADGIMFKKTGGGSKVNIFVRIFVPSEKSPSKAVGHYDLMIKGKLRLGGKNFTNPVFSYSTEGCLEIFSAADTEKIYKHKSPSDYYYANHMYTYHTSVKDESSVLRFLAEVGKHVKSVHTHPHDSAALECDLKGVYSGYSVRYVNCYLAVAKWMETFGKDGMMKYYDNFYKGSKSNYLPKTFVKKFKGKLKKKF